MLFASLFRRQRMAPKHLSKNDDVSLFYILNLLFDICSKNLQQKQLQKPSKIYKRSLDKPNSPWLETHTRTPVLNRFSSAKQRWHWSTKRKGWKWQSLPNPRSMDTSTFFPQILHQNPLNYWVDFGKFRAQMALFIISKIEFFESHNFLPHWAPQVSKFSSSESVLENITMFQIKRELEAAGLGPIKSLEILRGFHATIKRSKRFLA